MGVEAARVETAGDVAGAIDEALATDGPFLIDLVIGQDVPGHEEAARRRPVAGTRFHHS
jgi:thiamine pyrophosphate-dependent acetolactate synthase large subunit-like protein